MRNYLFAYEDLPSVQEILSSERIAILNTGAKQWVRIRLPDRLAMEICKQGIPLHMAADAVVECGEWVLW